MRTSRLSPREYPAAHIAGDGGSEPAVGPLSELRTRRGGGPPDSYRQPVEEVYAARRDDGPLHVPGASRTGSTCRQR